MYRSSIPTASPNGEKCIDANIPSPSLRMSWLNSIGRVVTPLILTMQSSLLRQLRDEGMFPPLGQGARQA